MATFILRWIDDALWKQFCAKAEADGLRRKEALLRLIADYVQAPPTTKGGPQ
jgi:hypothetical protein